jgi:5-methylcytosine-specific restriction endonuclease McrA
MVAHALITFHDDVIGIVRGKEKILFRRGEKMWIWIERTGKIWTWFRKMILKYRGERCEDCGASAIELHIHHTVPVSEDPTLIYDKGNCVVLCISCHKKRHSRSG